MSVYIIAVVFFVSVILFAIFTAVMFRLFGIGMMENKDINIVVAFDDTDNVKDKLVAMTEDLSAECISSGIKIIILDVGMNNYQKELCRVYCDMYSFYAYSMPDNINELLITLKKKKAM